jgi:hypothetical protein
MRRAKMLGLVMVATSAIAATTATSASGHEFIASKTGKTASTALGEQEFTLGGLGHVHCTEASGEGELTASKFTAFKEIITYGNCNGGKVTISPAHFDFNAAGTATIEKTFTAREVGVECEVLIDKQTLTGFAYSNSAGKVTITADASGLHEVGTGGICGGEDTEGTYKGIVGVALEGGVIEWK